VDVVVTVAKNEVDAETICGFPRTNGIPCYHRKNPAVATVQSGWVGMNGPTEVLVRDADHDAALKLLTGD
jgi:hypothetical protein